MSRTPVHGCKKPRTAQPLDIYATGADAQFTNNNLVLLVFSKVEKEIAVQNLAESFCGTVIVSSDDDSIPSLSGRTVFVCGDCDNDALDTELQAADRVFIVSGTSESDGFTASYPVVDQRAVPVSVHGVGVLYPKFFGGETNYFRQITEEHSFQQLTESTKPGIAHRTGIYLTPVKAVGEESHFRLLRCSSNLSGPTLGFANTDTQIVDALNQEARCIFHNAAPLNHVLAQVYHNRPASGRKKEIKAKIIAHADKTKDMPRNGIMAFCTFYDSIKQLQALDTDPLDYGHKNVSGLTRLHFRLKKSVADRPGCSLKKHFNVTLYPDSVFFMPLVTNRLYTHEIRPSALNAERIPTRLGYVVRCSETEAVHKQGQTYIKHPEGLVPLEPCTQEGMAALRLMYAEENRSDTIMNYAGKFRFSMNQGDYLKPFTGIDQEFRQCVLEIGQNPFSELLDSVRFEKLVKGRRGNVILSPHAERGVPIVRTTSKYSSPAQHFTKAHESLANKIQAAMSLEHCFNNALVETYTNSYRTMGFHSDQSQDLQLGSSIALFSCYKDPENTCATRKLIIESKEYGEVYEIPLINNSVVVFSLDTNRRYKHKIVLDSHENLANDEWLGITFRTSRTFVKFRDGHAYFENGHRLELANRGQSQEFYALRRQENRDINFTYPDLPYTLSESDMIKPNSRECED